MSFRIHKSARLHGWSCWYTRLITAELPSSAKQPAKEGAKGTSLCLWSKLPAARGGDQDRFIESPTRGEFRLAISSLLIVLALKYFCRERTQYFFHRLCSWINVDSTEKKMQYNNIILSSICLKLWLIIWLNGVLCISPHRFTIHLCEMLQFHWILPININQNQTMRQPILVSVDHG